MKIYLKNGTFLGVGFLGLSILSILFIDKPLAIFIHNHGFDQLMYFRFITENLSIIYEITAILLILISSFEKHLLSKLGFTVYCILIILVTASIKTKFKIYLGREWVKTWSKAPISLINDNIYGFYGRHPNNWQGSYPSGHTSLVSVISFILLIIYPKYKYIWISLILVIIAALIILDFHFLGDCLAGIALGGIMSYYLIGIYIFLRNKFKSEVYF